MVRKLVVANQKGGVGKTAVAINLGAALVEQGRRVLLLDLDPQAGLTASLGIDPYTERRGMYALLTRQDVTPAQVTLHASDGLAVIPASLELAALESRLGTGQSAVFRLREALGRAALPFDYLIIDTPPSLGILTANALIAAGEVLIAVQAQYLAMRGVRALLDTLGHVRRRLNPALALAGVLVTMYRPDSLHAREALEEIRTVFPGETFQTVIPDSEAVMESPVAGQSVLTYAPDDPAAQAYRALAREIMAHE